MSLFNLIERIVFRGSENERYDPKRENRDHTKYYIRQFSKKIEQNKKDGFYTPEKFYVYGKCDIQKICEHFNAKGYTAATDNDHTIIIINNKRI